MVSLDHFHLIVFDMLTKPSDIGFIGGATTLASFKRDFGITADDSADISGNVVASMQAGCFFGALSIAFLTDKIGRKLGLVVSGIIVVVASALQTAACGRLGLFYAGRVIGGLGVGAASTLVPLYVSETSPKDIRGSLRK
jgi:MFS family permease